MLPRYPGLREAIRCAFCTSKSTMGIKKTDRQPWPIYYTSPRMHRTTSGPSGNLAEQPVGHGPLEFGPGVWMGNLTPQTCSNPPPMSI